VHSTRILLAVLLVVAVLIVVFATGWADDRAKPGSKGRAPVSTAAP
jgi:UDP-N-acetylmuramyl pentapeptide phosphotransferase/UDP-N-acetylglucosamine-1-phosphate transferase